MPRVVIVHLASASLGRKHLETFLDSYQRHPSGVEHELVLVLNGFHDIAAARSSGFLEAADGLDCHLVSSYPLQIDLVAYRTLAHELSTEFICFLNATSEVLGDGWLGKMHRYAVTDGIGLVGATGSYGTHRGAPARSRLSIVGRFRTARAFPRFPNPHIRTNAFMVRRQLFADLRAPNPTNKLDAYRLESGKDGLTAELRQRGLRALVVGRDGTAYEVPEWPTSGTFHAGGQHNLLVADRRTREWDAAATDARARMSIAAWGASNPSEGVVLG